MILRTEADVDQLVDALLTESCDHTMAALYLAERPTTDQGYPDHDFRVGINAKRKVGGLKFAGTSDGTTGVWYAMTDRPQAADVFYEYAGHPEDFPSDSECRSMWSDQRSRSSWRAAATAPEASNGGPGL
ncbi:immunity protein Imm1 of predicted polymorphic toxin system [Kribbella sp. VKM Ac-2527]|uniref:Immunity protein Imm1 of predicted polymorphic toxin system n=1 Tax=Kribbella caucasensis TaxID=2512215 RepID=A0A4R6KL46_9ACTN|nr:Imm1 family immunity protein [Kribbella sp. VKM Ac-2527]TDO51496.1 immunity protein Imm1 of predicted polymorphic toxin system [Kribbella sp. VKM Ac-2527]